MVETLAPAVEAPGAPSALAASLGPANTEPPQSGTPARQKRPCLRRSSLAKENMAATIHSGTSGWVGQSLKRKEDARLVRGKGKFVDDIKMLGMLYLVFVRSPFAHAKITGSMSPKPKRCPAWCVRSRARRCPRSSIPSSRSDLAEQQDS